MANEVEPAGKKNEITVVRDQLEKMGPQFQAALPAHIPLERFERVVMTAIQNNMDLVIKCSRQSLFNACIKAAQDGLLPDGREGAIVAYDTDATWMPMVFGIRKKVRNSGEIKDWDVEVVCVNDRFEHMLGTEKYVRHQIADGPRGDIIKVYSIANLTDEGTSIEIMNIEQVEVVRKQSSRAKSSKSPWNVPAFYEEMVKKTVVRRHAKRLPMSSDLDDLIRRDDPLYNMEAVAHEAGPRRHRLGAALDQLGHREPAASEGGAPAAGNGNGDPAPQRPTDDKNPAPKPDQQQADPAQGGEPTAKDAKPDKPPKPDKPAKDDPPKVPTNEREWKVYTLAWIDKALADGNEEELNTRWNSPDEKALRNRANVSSDVREECFDHLAAAREKFATQKGA
jgi:recombination protein RecT